MTFARARIAAGLVVAIGSAVTACAAVIGIGDPGLDLEGAEAGTLPFEASTPQDTSTDTSTPPPKDGGAADADGAAFEASVPCGAATTKCAVPPTTCCSYRTLAGGYDYSCAAQCPPPSAAKNEIYLTTLKCSRTSDCPGPQVCCLVLGFTGGSSECKASCSSAEYLMCEPAPAANTCPTTSAPCQVISAAAPLYGYCK